MSSGSCTGAKESSIVIGIGIDRGGDATGRLHLPSRSRDDASVGKRAVAVLSILAAVAVGAIVALTGSGDDPVTPSPSPDRRSSLFVEPEGTDTRAYGDY